MGEGGKLRPPVWEATAQSRLFPASLESPSGVNVWAPHRAALGGSDIGGGMGVENGYGS